MAHGSVWRRRAAFGLLAVALLGASIGGTGAVVSWAPWEGSSAPQVVDVTPAPETPAPTPRRPEKRLTAPEASELAERYLGNHRDSFYSTYGSSLRNYAIITGPISCGETVDFRGRVSDSPEFNAVTNQWIVACRFDYQPTDEPSRAARDLFRVDAETGALSAVR